MKGQISRESYDAQRRYSGVYQQQGRMLTDADWNELSDISKLRLDDALYDVVGSGAPRDRGVTVLAPTTGATALRLAGSHLYAQGVKGTIAQDPSVVPSTSPFPIDQQADFPSWNYLPTPRSEVVIVYADIWERPVLFSEDSSLLDPGLQGADTCFRTQTMAQVKWARTSNLPNPEDASANPRLGTATLSVLLRAKRSSPDPCDPCADEVELEQRVGNYLFRLEVHHVEGPPHKPTRIWLKWSTENGAEHYPIASVPAEFASGSWIWEFYSQAADKHLGFHPTPGVDAAGSPWAPTRGSLQETYPGAPTGDFVRRWDGYAVLDIAANGSVSLAVEAGKVLGMDRGVRLALSAADSPGAVSISAGAFTVYLDSLKLSLGVEGRTFLAGDYWLAPVREREHEAGDTVLDGATPTGIVHHYVTLARVKANGTIAPANTATLRKLNFPPLTDLWASDIAYSAECDSGLFDASHDTVRKALNRLCHLDATHVHFTIPCTSSIYLGMTVGTVTTVDAVLGLLCNVRAEQISYATGACSYIAGQYNGAAQVTVQQAIDALCARTSGAGCCVSVSPGQDLAALISDLAAKQTDICICLLAGDHVFSGILANLRADRTLHIHGCGRDCTTLTLQTDLAVSGIASLWLRDIEIKGMDLDQKGVSTRLLVSGVGGITIESTYGHGNTSMEAALYELSATGRILLRDNVLRAYDKTSENASDADRWSEWIGDTASLGQLFLIDDPVVFQQAAASFANQVAADAATATSLGRALQRADERLRSSGVGLTGRAGIAATGTAGIARALQTRGPELSTALLAQLVEMHGAVYAPGLAIMITDAEADVMLDHNDVFGIVSFYGTPSAAGIADEVAVLSRTNSGNIRVTDTGRTLHMRDNLITRVDSVAEQQTENGVVTTLNLFLRMIATGNVYASLPHRFMARRCNWCSNRFESGKDNEAFAYVICDNAVLAATAGPGDNEGDAAPRLYVFANPRGRVSHAATLGLFIFT